MDETERQLERALAVNASLIAQRDEALATGSHRPGHGTQQISLLRTYGYGFFTADDGRTVRAS